MPAVRVLPDVAGVGKEFDYAVDDGDTVEVGDLVRIPLRGRATGGWVTAVDVEPPPGVTLRPIRKWSSVGPPAGVVHLARWVAWRWAGRTSSVLTAASPPRNVSRAAVEAAAPAVATPAPQAWSREGGAAGRLLHDALAAGGGVVRLPPCLDLAPALASVVGPNTLVVVPTVAAASALARDLSELGHRVGTVPDRWAAARAGGVVVVGARAAALAPLPIVSRVVVVDEHDETHQEERSPTWHARDVAVERARRDGAPWVLVSPCPSLEALALGPLHTLDRAGERAGWPIVDVVDLGREDRRRTGVISTAVGRLVASDARVVIVLNRKGRSVLLACASCDSIARCERCTSAVAEIDGRLVCRRCTEFRPVVCARCGATRMKVLRRGIGRLAEEVAALARDDVDVVDAGTDEPARSRVVVGTEAALHRTHGPVDAVVFAELDQELLAPRYRASEEAMALIVRAARRVGDRGRGGRVVLQTQLADHPVVRAAHLADPGRLVDDERATRELLRFPPCAAVASVSGAGASAVIDQLVAMMGIEVSGDDERGYLVRAATSDELAGALAEIERPSQRVRIAVDPMRL